MSTELKSLYVTTHDYTTLTKVGVSNEPLKRLNAIKTSVGAEMQLCYESQPLKNWKQIEQIVLNHFYEKKTAGEWLNETPEKIIKYIKSIENLFNLEENYSILDEVLTKGEVIGEAVIRQNDKEVFDECYNLKELQNFVYKDSNYNFYVFYHFGEHIVKAYFNIYSTANRFAKNNLKRTIKLDLENKEYIFNKKFRVKNE